VPKRSDAVVLALRALAARNAGSPEQALRLLEKAQKAGGRHPALTKARQELVAELAAKKAARRPPPPPKDELGPALKAGDLAASRRAALALARQGRFGGLLAPDLPQGRPRRRLLGAARRARDAWAWVLLVLAGEKPAGPAPRERWAGYAAGLALMRERRFAAAAKAFLRAAELSRPPSWRALAFAAEAELLAGRRVRSEALMRRAAECVGEEKAELRVWQGELLLMQMRCAEAASLLAPVAKGSRYGLCWLGAALLRLNKPEDALKVLHAAPDDEETQFLRAEALLTLDRPNARRAVENVCSRFPGNPYAPLLRRAADGDEKAWRELSKSALRGNRWEVRTSTGR
jgi:tetratricopeptide (TPR) repeat protein